MITNSNIIDDIIAIGKSKSFENIIVEDFVPNYPTLIGGEFIFSIHNLRKNNLHIADLCLLIQGLHFIELKYRQQTGNDFGFGSSGQTNNLIAYLNKRNQHIATEIINWIRKTGGNYYYKIFNNEPPGGIF
jgi:hypothetical protein